MRRLYWIALAMVAVIGMVWFAYSPWLTHKQPIAPEEFRPVQEPSEESPATSIIKSSELMVKHTEITLSSPDGLAKVRLRSEYLVSEKGTFSLPSAEFEFFFKENKKLYLLARNLTYTVTGDIARVSGSLMGEVVPSSQRFVAKNLVWLRPLNMVRLSEVELIDPAFRVRAKYITINLETNELEISEEVEVNF